MKPFLRDLPSAVVDLFVIATFIAAVIVFAVTIFH